VHFGTRRVCWGDSPPRHSINFVGAREQHRRDFDAERFGSLAVNHQLEFRRLLYRKFVRLSLIINRPSFRRGTNFCRRLRVPALSAPGVDVADLLEIVDEVKPVGDEPVIRKPRMNPFFGTDASANTITLTQTETVKAVMRGIRRVEPRIAGSFRGCEHRGRSAGRR
jgi:hypothetical protein